MLRNKVSPNDESVHSQSKDERKQEAARSPEPVNQIDILTNHMIVFALCQIFHNRAGHQAVWWPWPWPWSWCSSALVHVAQFRVSYQTRIQRSWSTGRTILLKDKSQSWPTSRSCLLQVYLPPTGNFVSSSYPSCRRPKAGCTLDRSPVKFILSNDIF